MLNWEKLMKIVDKIKKIKRARIIDKIDTTINIEIAKQYRAEAKEILLLCNEKELKEYFGYIDIGSGNISCLVLDTIKIRLVKDNIMSQKDDDGFGKYDYLN